MVGFKVVLLLRPIVRAPPWCRRPLFCSDGWKLIEVLDELMKSRGSSIRVWGRSKMPNVAFGSP